MKMAPNHGYILTDASGEPVSRTYQYRKVMKPMLERKRRARINRCLDELKELMTGALQTEGENVAKLEKADILELTVRHLHNIRRQTLLSSENNTENTYVDRFKAGFRQCAAEVTHFLGTRDQQTSVNILKHLNGCIKRLETVQQQPQDSPQFTNLAAQQQQAPQSIQSIKQEVQQQQQQQYSTTQQTIKQEPQLTISKTTTSTPPPWIKPIPSTTLIQQNYHHTNSYYNNNNNNNNNFINDNNNNINNLVKHRHNLNSTILLSPKINVEDIPVWRPW